MTSESTGTNRLAREKSPYLEQHADNPVDWYPWGEEALREARDEDKPIFLSIGYSTCHWCHVMERESFEDEEMARRLNEVFVPVKVDREERPDLDGLYMAVCQSLTGSGGWPLTVLLTPEAKPFFAGTYFPKRSQGRRMGLMELTERVGELWQNQRERLERSAGEILEAVGGGEEAPGDGEALPAEELTRRAYDRLSDSFDEDRGGFGRAPKFPSPQNLLFLLRYGHRTGTERAWEMVDRTLKWMRRGGVYDHLGGGFHRYSTDARWLLPHFEKMLHDQALLALASVEAWQVTGEEAHARTAREIFDYARRDLRHSRGGFYSAEDADSEGGEGTFYVWTLEELRSVLPEEDVPVVREAFGVREEGNYAEESTGRRTGENVLHHPRPLAEVADELGLEIGELRERLDGIRARLFEVREERPRPHRDEKVLTDWNGLMIGALARAGAALDESSLVDDARETAGFLLSDLRDEEGRLLHRWRDGEAAIPAMADDYAFLVFGLLELYQATLEPRWLEEARALEREFEERCWDPDAGGYYLSGADVEDVPVRRKEVHDGALPSANSMAHWNALRLARLTGEHELEEKALRLEDAFAGRLESRPEGHAMFMVGLDFRVGEGQEVVLAGVPGAEGADRMLDRLRRQFRPRTVLLGLPASEAEADRIRELAPFTREMEAREGRATAYVCRDFTCERPTADPDEMEALLEGSPAR